MNVKRVIQAIGDSSLSLQERIFRLLVMIGLGGLGISVLVGVLAGENKANFIPLVVAFFVFLAITYISIRCHKIQFGAVFISCIIIFFILPYNFLTSGGIYGGGPIWFLFGVVFVCLVVERKIKYVLITCGFLLQAACYYIAYFHPELIVSHTIQVAHIDSFATLLIITVLICCMILFQNSIYRKENAIARKQKKEIEELNQMQNRFFSSMSHEIRTPINTIIGLNEMILREEVSDEVASDARSIQGASKMLLTLINDILDMSKIESGKMDIVPVTYDAGDMLSDVVNMIWVRAKEKDLEFHIDVDQTMPSQLVGDEVRIKQILINVLNNAVKYTTEGSVTLSIQCKRQKNDCVNVTYSVTDTGMGIKKESIPYLFSAFRRVDEAKNRYIEGTGLGLSIVKQLVELMDGEISVNSVYTKGSTFMITIPQRIAGDATIGEIDLEARHTLNVREHYKQMFEAPKAHVLIVDDNKTNLMVAEKLLRETKVNITTATSGAECLQKTLQNRYEVILMDHLMPNMDGIECLHAIQNQIGGLNQNTPVVALTANAGGEHRALYRREGFAGYLLKPVSGVALETELLRHLPKGLVSTLNASGSAGVLEAPVLMHRKKMPILISTDSASDLPKYLVEKYQIAIMPFRVLTEGGDFLDGVEAETDGILSYMNQEGKNVKSEPPDVESYEEFFAEQLTKAQYILHIAFAKNASNAYENALEASKTFDNVKVIDSGHLSSGMGIMALAAAECVVSEMTQDAIVKEMEKVRKHIRSSFIVTDTKFLARSGRVSEKIHALCKAFMIHPVIVLKDSSMKVGALRIGAKDYAWRKYITSTLNHSGKIDKRLLFITYAGLTREELMEIKEQVKAIVPFEQIICQKASPAVATNCGPGTFGLLFVQKD